MVLRLTNSGTILRTPLIDRDRSYVYVVCRSVLIECVLTYGFQTITRHSIIDAKMAGEERLENVNPEIFAKSGERPVLPEEMDDNVTDEIDVREIFGKIANFNFFFVEYYSYCKSRVF